MKKLILAGLVMSLVGCSSEPESTGNINEDLMTIYGASKVETLGEQLIVTLPLADASSETNMVFKTFNNIGNSLNYILRQYPDIAVSNIYYMISADLTDNTGKNSQQNLMGMSYKISELKNLYQGDDLPFQAYLPYADMDYKQTLGKKAVLSWCAEQADAGKYANVCQ